MKSILSALRKRKNGQETGARGTTPRAPTYRDIFEVMRYDRGMDVMPYAYAYRPYNRALDPTGPEPNFTMLDTPAEVEAFLQALDQPLVYERPGVISPAPLDRWNQLPAQLSAAMTIAALYYPDDESKDWPFLQVVAVGPEQLASGHVKATDIARGRYAFRQFLPHEKRKIVEEMASRQDSTIFIEGKLPDGMANTFNPAPPGKPH